MTRPAPKPAAVKRALLRAIDTDIGLAQQAVRDRMFVLLPPEADTEAEAERLMHTYRAAHRLLSRGAADFNANRVSQEAPRDTITYTLGRCTWRVRNWQPSLEALHRGLKKLPARYFAAGDPARNHQPLEITE